MISLENGGGADVYAPKWGGCRWWSRKMGGGLTCGRRPRDSGHPPPQGDFETFPNLEKKLLF